MNNKTFEGWLVQNDEKTEKSAYSYKNAIPKLSKHYSEQTNSDINLENVEIELLEEICELYKKTGKYADFGENSKGTNRNALIALVRYKKFLKKKKFTWVTTHLQLANSLKTLEGNQPRIIEILKTAGVTGFSDKDDNENDIPLEVIDPFTFFCYIYKYGEERRLNVLQNIAKQLNLSYPEDESGIPSSNAQKVWLFPYQSLRVNNEIERLWAFFNDVLKNNINNSSFEDLLSIRGIARTKLTEALFNVNPKKFFPINGPTKPYLQEVFDINPKFKTFDDYQNILAQLKSKTNKPFYQLSYEAWLWNQEHKNINYWVFQGNPNVFDFKTALEEDVLKDWTASAHKDKIKIGDKVILWITGKEAGCYALAEITTEPESLVGSPDKHLWKTVNKNELKAGIKITHNLVRNPIYKSLIENNAKLQDLKVGNQGTNFKATKEEYESFLQIIENNMEEGFFELYREYLIKKRGNEITSDTINGYYEAAKKDSPQWMIRHGVIYEKIMNNDKSELVRLKEAVNNSESGFNGFWSFQHFVNKFVADNKVIHPLNKILYGPPGTGKTYKTKKIAVEIIENVQYSDSIEDREVILEKYDEYVKINQVHFTTFHQSMSYEDFIEGIKPKMNDDEEGELSYEIQDGIFKTICNKAKKSKIALEKDIGSIAQIEPFDTAWNKLIEMTKSHLSDGKLLKIGSWEYGLSSKESLKYESLNSPSKYTFTITKKNIYDTYQNKLARPSGAFQKDMKDILSFMKNQFDLKDFEENLKQEEKKSKQNYVIIIDEINRGNVSAIFGELITLIEKDKRAGEKESIQVTLPYSKESFSVPGNLYIIGTMNTADRSVEALDTALRRRFSFEEVLPKPSLLNDNSYKEVDLATLVKTINKRVELLVDKDHQIGHSYFINIDSFDSLKTVFKDKIIPLLEEYFYGNFGKIGLVLGEAFVEQTKTKNKTILAKFKGYEDLDFIEDKLMFKLKNIDKINASEFISIYENVE